MAWDPKNEKQRIYWEENKEKMKAKARAKWALAHPPKTKQTPEERKAKQREYYQDTKEQRKLYYQENKEELRTKAKAKYKETHPPKSPLTEEEKKMRALQYYKKYYEKNKEKIVLRSRQYYEETKDVFREKRNEYSRQYCKINREKIKAKQMETRDAFNEWRRLNRDPIKEAERSKDWRFGKGREAYIKCKENYRNNNRDAVNESQRKAYARNWFKGLDAPKELVEAKYLQLMIERKLNEKCI
jgi:hypothetical protein